MEIMNAKDVLGYHMYLVKRDKGDVLVTVMINMMDSKYHFVNITNGHICECGFDCYDDAIHDMDKKIESGEIIGYHKIERAEIVPVYVGDSISGVYVINVRELALDE